VPISYLMVYYKLSKFLPKKTIFVCGCYDMFTLQGRLQDRMAGGKEEYNAFFYSLVSTDTQVGLPLVAYSNYSNILYEH